MGTGRCGRWLVVSLAVALVAIALCFVSVAAAGSSGTQKAPKIVKELVNLRTADSSTYLLSNGQRRAQISAVPIHFKDAHGVWHNFDTTLRTTSLFGSSYGASSLPFGATLRADPARSPAATLSYDGYRIGLRLLGASESGGLAFASTLTFPSVAPQSSESYRLLNYGLEQSLTLDSPQAPSTFVCSVTHAGLTLRKDGQGQWGFYRPGRLSPLARLSSLLVFDSAKNAGGLPAFCTAATMKVTPGRGESTLTYTVPRSWLMNPKRVYPVQIDPICYFPNFFPNVDTEVSSASPNTAFGGATQLNVGYDGTGYWRTLVRFDLSSIPASAYVHATDLNLYKCASGGSNGATTVSALNEAFTGSSTWNSLGCQVNSLPSALCTTLGTVPAQAVNTWNDFDQATYDEAGVDHTVQRWISGAQTNDGFLFSQDESGAQGAAYLAGYDSLEYDGDAQAPDLWVEYELAPVITVSTDHATYNPSPTQDPNSEVAVCIHLSGDTATTWEEQLCINKAGGVQANYRGLMGLFFFDPNANDADGVAG